MRSCVTLFLGLVLVCAMSPQAFPYLDVEPTAIEKQLYARVQRDGGIADPVLPFILYVKKIEKEKLHGVEMLSYDAKRKKFARLARAAVMELRIDPTCKQLILELRNLEIKTPDGVKACIESQIMAFDLPEAFALKDNPLPKKENLPLSADDRKFLLEGFPKNDAPSIMDVKLKEAFGADCAELRRPLRLWLPDFHVVLAAGEFVKERNGDFRLGPCSMAQFARKPAGRGDVQIVLRSKSVRCDCDFRDKDWSAVRTITFKYADGTRVTVKKAE